MLNELSISFHEHMKGIMLPITHPLNMFLKCKCEYHLKKGCFIPKYFILIKNIPLSYTGKLDKKSLP